MESMSPTPKRRRTDGESEVHLDANTSDTPRITRSTEFWFTDGNVVLVCEDVGYRVHQRVLSKHSNFFEDLFTMGSSYGNEMFDGCPLLQLQDPAGAMSLLLGILYARR